MHGWPSAMEVKQMVIPHVRCHACESHMAKTTIDKQQGTSIGKPRRSSGRMREDHLENGTFLVEFKEPDNPVDMVRRPIAGIGPDRLLSAREWQSAVDKYRAMERKGFRVTRDIGCLIPDPQYSTYQHVSMKKGHQRTFAFFARWIPVQIESRNEFGWPSDIQISHLCHRRSCARIDHLIAEERWRNEKRSYCGSSGECDCGNEIKCLRRYQMESQFDNPLLCQTKSEAREALNGAPEFVVHGKDRFLARDRKARQRMANKKKRKRKQALHLHVTKRKQSRLASRGSDV